MIPSDGFDRTVSTWLHADAEHRVPDHLDAVLRRTRTVRQRPAWSSLERWLPMQTTLQLTPVPRVARVLFVLALLIVAIAGAIVAAGALPRRADPFGPARNGPLVYGGGDGDLYRLDPSTGEPTALVTGPAIDMAPSFSPDGSRFVFVRADSSSGPFLLMVANPDGSRVRRVAGPLSNLTWYAWSPDGARIAAIFDLEDGPALSVIGIDGSVDRILGPGLSAETVQWRPGGRELVFRGLTSRPGRPPTYGLYAVHVDGTGLRPIQPPTVSDGHWQNPALSPDGTKVMYTQWDPEIGGGLWVVDVDGGPARRLTFDGPPASDFYATWSADGAQIVFNRGRPQETYHLAVGPAAGGHAVDIGPELPWDAAAAAGFSPDGSKVVARYGNGSTWILDVAGGPGRQVPPSDFLASWQRLAR